MDTQTTSKSERNIYLALFLLVVLPATFFTIAVNMGMAQQATNSYLYSAISIYIVLLTFWYALRVKLNWVISLLIALSTFMFPFMIWGSFILLLWRTSSIAAQSENQTPMPDKSFLRTVRNMFGNLTEFNFKRNRLQAVGFYIFWVGSLIFVGQFLLQIYANFGFLTGGGFEEALQFGAISGAVLSPLVSAYLSLMILKARGRIKDFKYVALAIVGVAIALGGAFLGILIPAFLSTISKQEPA